MDFAFVDLFAAAGNTDLISSILGNISHNLFKPLLLFFYVGFLIPVLGVKFEFPKPVYQGLTIYLLLAIGWHGGEELASLDSSEIGPAIGFMILGLFCNTVIGITTYLVLRATTRLRNVDAATVAGYYGSDSAGTFVTALGVLTAVGIAYAAYMPVMLAVMEIPGCLVALGIVSWLRSQRMDGNGNMPNEPGYDGKSWIDRMAKAERKEESEPLSKEEEMQAQISLGTTNRTLYDTFYGKSQPAINFELLHEVFFNPGIYLLFAGIAVGCISRMQGESVTKSGDALFNTLFQGILCLFLLEMGITASERIRDLKEAGWQFIAFALVAPNVFATFGIIMAHLYGMLLGHPFEHGTYVAFAVLCGAASYIALPAVQRLAIPEASPTLPLAASLGVTFSYNVTVGIPLYIAISEIVMKSFPIG